MLRQTLAHDRILSTPHPIGGTYTSCIEEKVAAMRRRDILAGAGSWATGATLSFPAPAIAQGIRELKMVTPWAQELPGAADQCGAIGAIDYRVVGRPSQGYGLPGRQPRPPFRGLRCGSQQASPTCIIR